MRVDSSTTEIPEEAFKDSKALVRVRLPETLNIFGIGSFPYCSELRCVQFVSSDAPLVSSSSNPNVEDGTIVFPERAELRIDEGAFACCNSPRNVIVCSNSTKLGEGVFHDCQRLISAEFPEGLQVIEQWLFA
eukprot:scaffold11378_cov112-Cylindrotheca_fusiformis.AAC.2